MNILKTITFLFVCTNAKLEQYVSGYFPHLRTSSCQYTLSEPLVTIPDSWDWREHNAVTPVKNQGQCGSCWSFSATGAMEGAYAIATNQLINISEQQLLDCSVSYGNLACNGGLYDNAFEYATDHKMCTETNLPYDAVYETCQACQGIFNLKGCTDVPPNNETALKIAVYQQPVSVAIQADQMIFQKYKGGILQSSECGTKIDHAVLVVGYGTENGIDYWIVKNSWGKDWGVDGYIRIFRTTNGLGPGICGIASQPSFPNYAISQIL